VSERFSTFEIQASTPTRLADKLVHKLAHELGHEPRRDLSARDPGVGLLALTSEAQAAAEPIARALASTGDTWIVTTSPGVLSERGELEGSVGAVGLALPGVDGVPITSSAGLDFFGRDLEAALVQGRSALLLAPADDEHAAWLSSWEQSLGGREARLLGAGTHPEQVHLLVHARTVQKSRCLALTFDRRWLPRVASSAGCRLLSPLLQVTRTRGRTLLELEGLPALAVLSQSAAELEDAPLILLAAATSEDPLSAEGRKLALRAIVGVDPGRGGIDLSTELSFGARVAFAVRDPHAARTDLDLHLGTLRQTCRGTAPAFGLYICGSGRGRRLYDAADVDVRLIRSHFPEMPLFGFQSVFEIAPEGGRLWPQVHSGVLGLFCSPS
jgi:hypothetical protein